MKRQVIIYRANPADFPEHPDPCPQGGNHVWQPLNPFTTAPGQQGMLGYGPNLRLCDKCNQYADLPDRGTQRAVAPEAITPTPDQPTPWLAQEMTNRLQALVIEAAKAEKKDPYRYQVSVAYSETKLVSITVMVGGFAVDFPITEATPTHEPWLAAQAVAILENAERTPAHVTAEPQGYGLPYQMRIEQLKKYGEWLQ
jgi:hypothetical protein